MTYILVEVGCESFNTGGQTDDDEWSRDSSVGDAWVDSVYLVDKAGYQVWDTIEDVELGDIVYVVLAVYGTGDSFGSDGGQHEVFLVTKDQEEAELKKLTLENTTDYSVPWNGYFEWLQEIKISSHVVQ